MGKLSVFPALIFLASLPTSCAGSAPTPSPTSEADFVAAIVAATLSVIPPSTPVSSSTPFPSPTDTPGIAATGDWQFYHSEYGFTFEYPADRFEIIGNNPIRLENTILPRNVGIQGEAENGWLRYEITITPVEPGTLVADWVRKNFTNQDKADQLNIMVDGVEAIEFQRQDFEPKTNAYLFMIKDSNLIGVAGHYLNFSDSSYYELIKTTWLETTYTLLSTFKFTR